MSNLCLTVKKGKDCIVVAKITLDDICSGKEGIRSYKKALHSTERWQVSCRWNKTAGRIAGSSRQTFHDKDTEILCQIGELHRVESELKKEKSE